MWLSGTNILIENSLLVGNTGGTGAGFLGQGGSIHGTLISGNEARQTFGAGGIYGEGAALRLELCVVFRNVSSSHFHGLGAVYGGPLRLLNCIIAGHDRGDGVGLGWGSSLGQLDARHCLFHDNLRHFSDGRQTASTPQQLNALTGQFLNAFGGDPQWFVPQTPAGRVTAATFDANTRLTTLTLTGAALTPDSLRRKLIAKGTRGIAAVLGNTSNTVTLFGRHDSINDWAQWRLLDFHNTASSPAIDVDLATSSTQDPDGVPRGVDLTERDNFPGAGFDVGIYEYPGSIAASALLRIQRSGSQTVLCWPAHLRGWRLTTSRDLRSWTPVEASPTTDSQMCELGVATEDSGGFFRLEAP